MKQTLITLSFLIYSSFSYGQEKMVVDQAYNGNVYYESSKFIDSIGELPTKIRLLLKLNLQQILGSMVDSITFSHGQIVDLQTILLNKDSANFKFIPKYDLNFILRDKSIGILRYYLRITMDRQGELLFCNWPRLNYSDKSKFKSREEIMQYALKYAALKGYNITYFNIDLRYNQKLKKLCWVFKFPANNDKDFKVSKVFEIDWNFLEIIDEVVTINGGLH